MSLREYWERVEEEILSPHAAKSDQSRGRVRFEKPCDVRTVYQRDRDRILHSKAFRRLKHKTQVFISPEGDHYRTRLTHTLEVSQIARTIARALRLNEDLTEAIALGHDLGHTPFGHAGEKILDGICSFPFKHREQSLRVVDVLEDGDGLNLTWEVRDGILNHSGGGVPETLEGQVVHLSDRIAYINHDIEDAQRAGILKEEDIPVEYIRVLGSGKRTRINGMIHNIIDNSLGHDRVSMSQEHWKATHQLRQYMFDSVYLSPRALKEEKKTEFILRSLFEYYMEQPERIPHDETAPKPPEDGTERAVADFIAGMTDRYAMNLFGRLFIPNPWRVY